MTAVLLALGPSFGWGCSDFIAGVKTRALPVLSVLLVSQAAGLVLVLGAAVAWGGALPGVESVAWAVAAGGAELVGFAALSRGLAVGTMCVVAPINATAAVVPLLVGWSPRTGRALQGAGIALALARARLARGHRRRSALGAHGHRPRPRCAPAAYSARNAATALWVCRGRSICGTCPQSSST